MNRKFLLLQFQYISISPDESAPEVVSCPSDQSVTMGNQFETVQVHWPLPQFLGNVSSVVGSHVSMDWMRTGRYQMIYSLLKLFHSFRDLNLASEVTRLPTQPPTLPATLQSAYSGSLSGCPSRHCDKSEHKILLLLVNKT